MRKSAVSLDCHRHSSNEDYNQKISSTGESHTPEDWENVLGGLVVGRPVKNGSLVNELAGDPAVAIYQKLICSFRGSMVVGALPMTSRLLIRKIRRTI